ncbi:NADPH2:quinone reductase [Methylohalomonas lacus]|uniref:NADPH2:quinone reductase n=1 Tax=Methylohalomonas lacus TaxID=398773 RepID=A0AAE3L3N6_9GAMM|nr:YhdH/YhfP family quinone oxidoreductase [Methylohalomonas lacus]MCS3902438.1 NADPH2:quinone reductase [Methylohalomonas lacus]
MTEFSAFRVHEQDGEVRGALEPVVLESLSAGEVVIRAAWSSVNYKDALAATGKGRIIRQFPRIAGIDVAGTVHSSDDSRFRPGDAVLVTGYDFGVDHDGGYAEYCRVPAEWVVPLPDGLGLREAMILGTAGLTAAICIQRMETNGQAPHQGSIVVTGASGGVGSFAIDMLAGLGYRVTALTGKDSEHDYLKSLGAADILDRTSLDTGSKPMEKALWAGAVDNVGGEILTWLTRTTQPWGNITAVGLAGGTELKTTVMPFILRGVALLGVTSSGCPTALRHRLWQRLATDLKPRHLERIVSREVELADLPQVFDDMLAGKTSGRTLVKIAGE